MKRFLIPMLLLFTAVAFAKLPLITDVQPASFVAGEPAAVTVTLDSADSRQLIHLVAFLNCTGSFDRENKPVTLFTFVSPQQAIPESGQITVVTDNVLPDVPQQCIWQIRVAQGYDEGMSYWGLIFDVRSKQ